MALPKLGGAPAPKPEPLSTSNADLRVQYDTLTAQSKNKVCRRCKKMVGVAFRYIAAEHRQEYFLKCTCYPDEPQMKSLESTAEQYMRGNSMPVHTANTIERTLRRRGKLSTSLQRADVEKHLANFGSLSNTGELDKAMALVETHGFSPYMHLQLYQGRVMVNVDGQYWWARKNGEPFEITSSPIPNDLKSSYGVAAHEIGVIAKLYRIGAERPSCEGFGRASTDGRHPVQRGSAVEAQHPYRMAEKRAEAQALRKWIAIGDIIAPDLVSAFMGEDEDVVQDITEASVVQPEAPVTIDANNTVAETPVAQNNAPMIHAPYSDWITTCPKHNYPWDESTYGLRHELTAEQIEAGGYKGKNCYFYGVTQHKFRELLGSNDAAKIWMENNHPGQEWKKLTEIEQLESLSQISIELDSATLFGST